MCRISVLAFPPSAPNLQPLATDSCSLPDSASTLTLSHYGWALLAESRRARFNLFRNPSSLVFNRNSTTSVPFAASPRSPLLKVHIATTKEPRLLQKMSEILAHISPDASPEEWLNTALLNLQKAGIVQRFSVTKFHQFVLDSLSKMPLGARRMSSGTTEMDYLALLSSNAEVKKMLNPDPEADEGEEKRGAGRTLCGFSIFSGRAPMLTNRNLSAWERQDDPYGGLR